MSNAKRARAALSLLAAAALTALVLAPVVHADGGDGIRDGVARAQAAAQRSADNLGNGLGQIGDGLGRGLNQIGDGLGGSLSRIGSGLGTIVDRSSGGIAGIFQDLNGNHLDPTPGTTSSVEYLVHEGVARRYVVIRPEPVTVNAPLMILLHAHGLAPERMANLTRAGRIAVTGGAWVFLPEASDNGKWHEDPSRSGPDDIGFIKALIEHGIGVDHLDAKRVYIAGYSSGGFMALRAACSLSPMVAAVGAVAASLRDTVATSCVTTHPTSVAQFNGTSDLVVPYNGEFNALHGAQYSAAFWAGRAGCVAGQTQTTPLPDAAPADGTTVSLLRYTGCPAGTDVRLYTVDKGGHTWPDSVYSHYTFELGRTSFDIDATLELWQFLIGHSLP